MRVVVVVDVGEGRVVGMLLLLLLLLLVLLLLERVVVLLIFGLLRDSSQLFVPVLASGAQDG